MLVPHNNQQGELSMIYLDMDGVLAKYSYAMYSQDTTPKWDEVGSHVFRNLQRDEFMYLVVEQLAGLIGNNLYTLTSVSDKSVAVHNEQIIDKMNWLAENYPMINLCNFMSCSTDKRNTITKIKGFKLTSTDILIDDYNPNLYAWREAGGTAIKYINTINSVGLWPGPYIGTVEREHVIDLEYGAVRIAVTNAVNTIFDVWYKAGGKYAE